MIYSGSRYANSNKLRNGNRAFLSVPSRVNFNSAECSLYQVIAGDTIDGISKKFYGDAKYWWCIMDANREYQSEVEIKAGDIIQIPSMREVQKVV